MHSDRPNHLICWPEWIRVYNFNCEFVCFILVKTVMLSIIGELNQSQSLKIMTENSMMYYCIKE